MNGVAESEHLRSDLVGCNRSYAPPDGSDQSLLALALIRSRSGLVPARNAIPASDRGVGRLAGLAIVSPRRLRKSRRYAIVACGLVAAVPPGDAVTLLLETVPLYLLFELAVLLAVLAERRARKRVVVSLPGVSDPV